MKVGLLLFTWIKCTASFAVPVWNGCQGARQAAVHNLAKSRDDGDDDDSISNPTRRSFLNGLVGIAAATVLPTPTKSMIPAQYPPVLMATGTSTSATTLQESISGFFAGGALSAIKTFVKFPLDTATVRLQMTNTPYSISKPGQLMEGSYRGVLSPLLCNIPGGALFFAVKDATKTALRPMELPKWQSTCVAVAAASLPYWVFRNPSEVVKTKQQAMLDGYQNISTLEAFQKEKDENGLGGFFVGFGENIVYAYPADVIKFLAYEQLTSGRPKNTLTPAEGAVAGAIATAAAQFLTTPLDVVRNRVMAGGGDNETSYVESLATISREEGIAGLFAGASPRVGKAVLSGAIQFATYEETKQKINSLFESRR